MVRGTTLARGHRAIGRANAKNKVPRAIPRADMFGPVGTKLNTRNMKTCASGGLSRRCSNLKHGLKSAKSCHFLCHRPNYQSRLKRLSDRRFGVSDCFHGLNCRDRLKRLSDKTFRFSRGFHLRRGTKRTKSATKSAISLISFGLRIGHRSEGHQGARCRLARQAAAINPSKSLAEYCFRKWVLASQQSSEILCCFLWVLIATSSSRSTRY
jgi:hypothetical protein